MKETDDILISEYWLSDLVSWDNTASHRITVLSWSQAAYFRHRESSIKLYPNHQLTEGGLENRNWMEEHQKQSCTSRGHLFMFSPSLPLKFWTAFLAVACFFSFLFAVMKWYCGESHTNKHSNTDTQWHIVWWMPTTRVLGWYAVSTATRGLYRHHAESWVMPVQELFK